MLRVSELSGRRDKASFDCGNAELNNHLRQIAGQHVRKSLARVYFACEEARHFLPSSSDSPRCLTGL